MPRHPAYRKLNNKKRRISHPFVADVKFALFRYLNALFLPYNQFEQVFFLQPGLRKVL